MTAAKHTPGPWEPFYYQSSVGKRYWTGQRYNRSAWAGQEILSGKGGMPRKFGSEEAAKRACDAENAAIAAATGSAT